MRVSINSGHTGTRMMLGTTPHFPALGYFSQARLVRVFSPIRQILIVN